MASYSRYPPSSPIRACEPSRPSYGIGLDNSPKRRSTESPSGIARVNGHSHYNFLTCPREAGAFMFA